MSLFRIIFTETKQKPKAMKTFSIDNQNPVSRNEIVNNNELANSDLISLDALNINESCYMGIVEVKRIK